MVETKRITTPIKVYGSNYITKRCVFAGDVQNRPALYDNMSENKAVFYNTDTTQPVTWRVDFKNKYGQVTVRAFDHIIIEKCTAEKMLVERFTPAGEIEPVGEFLLTQNTVITLPQSVSAQALIFKFYCSKNYFEIGEVRVLKFLFDLAATSELEIVPNADGGEYTAQDGSFYSWTNYHRPGVEIKINNGNFAQYKELRRRVEQNESITLLPMRELDFWVLEGMIGRDLSLEVSRFSGLVDYTLEVVSK